MFGLNNPSYDSKTVNSYYLDSSASQAIAFGKKDTSIAENISRRSAMYMKSNQFILNLGEKFKIYTNGINSGYPILGWQ